MKITKKLKPLATVGTSPRAEIHRAKFQAFAAMKYMDWSALKKAHKAVVEIGRIEGGGVVATLVAEVHKGAITKLMPLSCKGCAAGHGKAGAAGRAATKRVVRQALERVRELGLPVVKLPIPLSAARSIPIDLGPIIIIFGPPYGIDFCMVVESPEGEICVLCLFGPGLCIGPVVID